MFNLIKSSSLLLLLSVLFLVFVGNPRFLWHRGREELDAKKTVIEKIFSSRPPALNPTEALSLYYSDIYQEQIMRINNGEKPQIAMYRYSDGFGFGNRLRGTYFVFLLSLLTRRLFLIDHEDFHNHFNSPLGFDFKADHFDVELRSNNLSKLEPSFNEACESFSAFQGTNLAEIIIQSLDVYIYNHGTSPDSCLLQRDDVKAWALKLFGTTSRFRITASITSLLLSRPKMELLLKVIELKRKMRWDSYSHRIAIQFRALVDVDLLNLPQFDSFCNGSIGIINNFIEAQNIKHPAIWVTSDYHRIPEMYTECALGLHDNVDFIESGIRPTHTSEIHPEKIKQPIVEWFLLGESDLFISTGTTFGIFSVARTNLKPLIYFGGHKEVSIDFVQMPTLMFCHFDVCF